jgi:hypothetical protein
MTSPKRKVLTLQQKVDAIKLLDAGKAACKIAAELGVGKTQILNLRKRKIRYFIRLREQCPDYKQKKEIHYRE